MSTYAEWTDSLRKKGLIVHATNPFKQFLEDHAVNWWPTPAVVQFPAVGSMERDVCQPFVKARLEELTACNGNVHKKKALRLPFAPAYLDKTVKVNVVTQVVDRCSFYSFSFRKPDVVGYAGESRGANAIVFHW